MIDAVALAFLTLLACFGWRRGTVLTALSGGSLVVGYLGAFLLYRPIGILYRAAFDVPAILAMPLGGMTAMVTISLVLRFVAAKIKIRRMRRVEDGWNPSALDRTGGAALGALWALGIVIFFAWAAIALRGLTGQGPDVEATATGRLASAAVGKGVYLVAEGFTGDEVLASTMALVAVKPGEGAASITRLIGDTRLRSLFEDPSLRSAILRSDYAAVSRHAGMLDLARDRAFLKAAESVHLVDDLAGTEAPHQVTAMLVERMAPMVRTADALSRDTDVQTILEDPQFLERLQGGNLGALATDPDFNRLAEKILATVRANSLTGTGRL